MEMYLTDNVEKRTSYTYTVTKNFIVEPNETWILDERITVVTCTNDGAQETDCGGNA